MYFHSTIQKNEYSFGIVLVYSYLCSREDGEATNQLMVAIGSIRANAAVVVAAYSRLRTDC